VQIRNSSVAVDQKGRGQRMNTIARKGGNNVFTKLMPLLAGRTVLIIVAQENDATLRVNVLKSANDNENTALTTPLSFVGKREISR
jgi:hypothetical protein